MPLGFSSLQRGDTVVMEHARDGYVRHSLEVIQRVTKTLIRLTNGMRFRKIDGSITFSSRQKHTAYRLLLPSEENKKKVFQDAEKNKQVIFLQKQNWHRFSANQITEIFNLVQQFNSEE